MSVWWRHLLYNGGSFPLLSFHWSTRHFLGREDATSISSWSIAWLPLVTCLSKIRKGRQGIGQRKRRMASPELRTSTIALEKIGIYLWLQLSGGLWKYSVPPISNSYFILYQQPLEPTTKNHIPPTKGNIQIPAIEEIKQNLPLLLSSLSRDQFPIISMWRISCHSLSAVFHNGCPQLFTISPCEW